MAQDLGPQPWTREFEQFNQLLFGVTIMFAVELPCHQYLHVENLIWIKAQSRNVGGEAEQAGSKDTVELYILNIIDDIGWFVLMFQND